MVEEYDVMRDDFLTIDSESDAQHCIERYGVALSLKFLPKKYLYLLGKSGFNKMLSDNKKLRTKLNEVQDLCDKRGEIIELHELCNEALKEVREDLKC